MSLAIFRSACAEDLATALAGQLRLDPRDPFEPVPIVVGSRGMERWLRHQLATELGIAANLVFPFPRQALDGLAAALLAAPSAVNRPFWQPSGEVSASRWQTDALTFAVLTALRNHLHLPEFEAVCSYLQLAQTGDPTIAFREFAFAREVADVLDKLLHDRHADVLQWLAAPETAGQHQWLALLLAAVGADDLQSPAQVRALLLGQRPEKVAMPPVRLFCLSTLGPSDRAMLAALAARVPLELYLLAPSHEWWVDIRSRSEHFRALQNANTAEDRALLELDRDNQNRLLAGLGIPSRDVQLWLETLSYREPAMAKQVPVVANDLHRVQQWIGAAGDTQALTDARLQGDGSVALHACWGAQRQVEVLRDQLLQLFQSQPGVIEPRDVLVMTPDIETFGPLVAAVFARRGPLQPPPTAPAEPTPDNAHDDTDDDAVDARGKPNRSKQLPAISVSIADLGLVRVNPVAEVLLAVLALADGRVAAPQLYALLALEPVRLRLALSVDDVADLRELIDESGMRWGLDAQDRQAVDQPALFQNTLDFGLERLALGALLADPEPLELLPVQGGEVVPVPLQSPERLARVAALGQLVNAVRAARTRQRLNPKGRSLVAWKAEWQTLLDDFALTSDKATWLTAQVRQELDEFAKAGEGFTGLLSLDAVRRALQGRFDLPVRGDRAITGAVTVCALQPMRSVPFKVIALLGMDDGAFPRARTRRAWDPFGQPKPGEVDPRLAQRHLLLETLLSARERLLILYNGFGKKPGEEFAPAVPVVELRDLLVEASRPPKKQWVTGHPLQPWSLKAFTEGRFTYAQSLAKAAAALIDVQTGRAQPQPMGLSATDRSACQDEDKPPTAVSIEELVKGLTSAADSFLRERLQVSIPKDKAELQGREPLELDNLEKWDIRDDVMQVLLADPACARDGLVDTLTRRLQAQGELPLRAGGEHMLQQLFKKVEELLTSFARAAGEVSPAGELLRLDVSVSRQGQPLRVQVQGAPPQMRRLAEQSMLEWMSPSKSDKPKNLLRTWIYLLMARATGGDVQLARVVGDGDKPKAKWGATLAQVAGELVTSELSAEQAHALLADLVQVWLSCRDRPLPLFAQTSWAYADKRRQSPGKVLSAVRAAWGGGDEGNQFKPGEALQPSHRALFAGWDPTEHLDPDEGQESFAGLALRVYGPLAQALQAGPAAALSFYQAAAAASEEAQ